MGLGQVDGRSHQDVAELRLHRRPDQEALVEAAEVVPVPVEHAERGGRGRVPHWKERRFE